MISDQDGAAADEQASPPARLLHPWMLTQELSGHCGISQDKADTADLHDKGHMASEPWRVSMFGGLRCRRGDVVIERFRTRKAASLLAYLCLHADRAHPREELIDLLWPDSDIEAGRANLRQALWFLRQAFERDSKSEPLLVADNSSVWLRPGSIVTDVAEFETALNETNGKDSAIQRRATAVDLYHGQLLSGFYDEWIIPERRRLEALYLGALHEQRTALAQAGDPARAIPFALRAIQVDPCNENSRLTAMRLYAALGDPASVRRQLDELTCTLNDELGEAPANETLREAQCILDEAMANESAQTIQQPVPAANLDDMSSISPRPLWKRGTAALAACGGVLLFIGLPVLRSQQSNASSAATHSPDDAMLAELRTLRNLGFVSGTNEQREAARRRHAGICIALGEEAWQCWYGHDEESGLNGSRNHMMISAVRFTGFWTIIRKRPSSSVEL